MKIIRHSLLLSLALLTLSAINFQLSTVFAQGTAFTYQGQLWNNGHPASGTYNLTFSLFNANVGGVAIAGPATDSAVNITNGLFTVLIDFGPGALNSATNWLEIEVKTNGAKASTTLAPRQRLTPVPYAIYAVGASAAGLTGTLSTAQLPPAVVTNGSSGVNLVGNFSGNGGSLTNLNYKNNFDSQTAAIIGKAVTNPGCVWLYTGGSNICFGSGFQAFSNACAAVNPADNPVDSVYVGPGTWNYYPTFTFPVNIYGAGAGQWDKRNSMFTGGTIITNTGGGTTTFYCGYSNSVFCNLAVEGTG